eukprot:TRINITY_DN419_c3_g1_i1.p1 TRINITY_DN419_c3_g1~~TRINITY_DN419_c3_g1_i1.p1  ORF type:complete len:648 (-),score=139.36 TRINITY_DN419_c3_g1_i1:7-1917(-)
MQPENLNKSENSTTTDVVEQEHLLAKDHVNDSQPEKAISHVQEQQQQQQHQKATKRFSRQEIKIFLNSTPPSVEKSKWCSWCFKPTCHTLVHPIFFGRSTHKCQSCFNLTCTCTWCSQGMVRCYQNAADKLCYSCLKLVPEWGKHPTPMNAWCSWCFQKSDQEIYQQSLALRNVYECSHCRQKTLRCTKCNDGMVRSIGALTDLLCVKCQGRITTWEKPDLSVTKLKSWCSWCISDTTHELAQLNKLSRDLFICSECKGPGLPCSCKLAMCKTGPLFNDSQCLVCSSWSPITWAELQTRKEALIGQRSVERVMAELERESAERLESIEIGMIRPFLILVAMQPMFRCQISNLLGLSLFTQNFFGDPHKEAWYLIAEPNRGIIARATDSYEKLNPISKDPSWCDILLGIIREALHHPLSPSKELSAAYFREASLSSQEELAPELEEQMLAIFIEERYLPSLTNASTKKEAQKTEPQEIAEKNVAAGAETLKDPKSDREDEEKPTDDNGNDSDERTKETDEFRKNLRKNANLTRNDVTKFGLGVAQMGLGIGPITGATFVLQSASMYLPVAAPFLAPALMGLSIVALPLAVVGTASLAAQGVNLLLGSSREALVLPTYLLLTARLILAAEGVCIEDYY